MFEGLADRELSHVALGTSADGMHSTVCVCVLTVCVGGVLSSPMNATVAVARVAGGERWCCGVVLCERYVQLNCIRL